MNIYFACSITGGREFESVYQVLVQTMLSDGHEVPTALLAETSIQQLELIIPAEEVYQRDVTWIRNADVLVAEVSTPSHGVGYEIGFALALGKPVLAFHRSDRRLSKMLAGNPDKNLMVRQYAEIGEAVEIVRHFLAGLETEKL